MGFSRRELFKLAGAGMLAPLLTGVGNGQDRRFLFVFVRGGWDPAFVFAPVPEGGALYQPNQSRATEIGGLTVVDASMRPQTRSFFERWASRTCILNGFEVRSITHERCTRLVLTGKSQADADDWPALLAVERSDLELPCLVVSGPSYTSTTSSVVMRLGTTGQLSTLLDGSAIFGGRNPARIPTPGAAAAIDAFVASRGADFSAVASAGQRALFGTGYAESLERLALINALGPQIDLSMQVEGWVPVAQRAQPALACLELGLTRCAVVEHAGQWDATWDSHSSIERQSEHYEVLFTDLQDLLEELEARQGPAGGTLLDETTVVVFSEMGRGPTLNAIGGKDHWTFTSAMLIGDGVRGGQVIGGYDEGWLGQPIDLASGAIDSGGTRLTSSHFGATLLALGGADVSEIGAEPILAALS